MRKNKYYQETPVILVFSNSNNLASYVHGNIPSAYLYQDKIYQNIVGVSLKKNNIYKIQDQLNNYDKVELFFSNPTSSRVNFLK